MHVKTEVLVKKKGIREVEMRIGMGMEREKDRDTETQRCTERTCYRILEIP